MKTLAQQYAELLKLRIKIAQAQLKLLKQGRAK